MSKWLGFVGLLFPFIVLALTAENTSELVKVEAVKEKRTSERGIYVTANVAQLPKRFKLIREEAKRVGLNTLVIDAKQAIAPPFLELLKKKKLGEETTVAPNPWLSKITKELRDEGFIVTARIVVFKDDRLVLTRPDLAVRLKNDEIYRDHKGGKWANPFAKEARLYNELIAESAAASGVDEIQFDYIRFPAEGKARLAYYPQEREDYSKVDALCDFLKNVRQRVDKYNTSLAVDIFGVTAWQSESDIKNLGQDLKKMAVYLDVLSPMLYPSHFHAGYDGFTNPGSHPYHFINAGVARSLELLSGEATILVPWVQGFNLRSPNYGPNYILEQIRGAKEAGVERYLIWNARNDYSVSFRALSKK